MVAFLWERPLGVWHVSALAALPPTGLFLVPWLLLFFPGESVRSWMLPTTLTMKGILVFAAQGQILCHGIFTGSCPQVLLGFDITLEPSR